MDFKEYKIAMTSGTLQREEKSKGKIRLYSQQFSVLLFHIRCNAFQTGAYYFNNTSHFYHFSFLDLKRLLNGKYYSPCFTNKEIEKGTSCDLS